MFTKTSEVPNRDKIALNALIILLAFLSHKLIQHVSSLFVTLILEFVESSLACYKAPAAINPVCFEVGWMSET